MKPDRLLDVVLVFLSGFILAALFYESPEPRIEVASGETLECRVGGEP